MVHSNKAKVSQSQSSVGQCWEGSCCYQLLLLRCSVLAWSSILDLFFTWLYTTAWSLVTGIRTNKQTCAYGSLERLSKQKAGYSLVSKNKQLGLFQCNLKALSATKEFYSWHKVCCSVHFSSYVPMSLLWYIWLHKSYRTSQVVLLKHTTLLHILDI